MINLFFMFSGPIGILVVVLAALRISGLKSFQLDILPRLVVISSSIVYDVGFDWNSCCGFGDCENLV